MKMKLKRISKNLTQKQLRELSGVGMNTIVELEKGNIDGVTVRVLKKIAAALDSTVQELFFDN